MENDTYDDKIYIITAYRPEHKSFILRTYNSQSDKEGVLEYYINGKKDPIFTPHGRQVTYVSCRKFLSGEEKNFTQVNKEELALLLLTGLLNGK